MTQQTINVGTLPNDGTGDTLLAAMDKINANFTDLYTNSYATNVVNRFNSRSGNITLTSADVTSALTYTPLNKAGDTATGLIVLNSGFVANAQSQVTSTAASSSTTTGALTVTGGVGIGGALNIGGAMVGTTLDGTVIGSITPAAGGFTTLTAFTSGSVQSVTVTDTGASGANIKLTGNGVTTPSKSIRVQGGVLQVVNNAYSAVIFSVSDVGNLTATGGIDNTVIGANTPAAVTGTTITTTGNFLGSGTGYSIGNTTGLASGGAIQLFDATHGNNVSILVGGSQVANFTTTGINNAAVGSTTPSTGSFTTLSASGTLTGFPGRLLNVQTFTSGTATYTPTTGTNKVIVEVQAPGGGSGGCSATTSNNAVSAPGAGGTYAKVLVTTAFSGVTVTIGAVGTAGGSGAPATNGGTGGTTSFGSIVSCPGGTGGAFSAAAVTGLITVTAAPAAATISGAASTMANTPGQAGALGYSITAGTVAYSGSGGNSELGLGGASRVTNAAAPTVGATGTGFGGGASGSILTGTQTTIAGAAGAPGIIVVYEFA
jgi:hypothetical protein